LHQALYESNRITKEQFLKLIPELIRAGYYPLPDPLTADHLVAHANRPGAPDSLAPWIVSDPEFWCNSDSYQVLQQLFEHPDLSDDQATGIAQVKRPTAPTAQLALLGRIGPEQMPKVLTQLEYLCAALPGQHDAVKEFVNDLMSVSGIHPDPAKHTRWIQNLFSATDDSVRTRVTTLILGIGEAS